MDHDKILADAIKAAKDAVAKQLDTTKNRLAKSPQMCFSTSDCSLFRVGLGEDMYKKLFEVVAKEIAQLRVILEGVEAREKERVWVKNQIQGELDDNRLVDGATGEKAIFKRRGNADPLFGGIQKKPKRIRFVMDVSSSMNRFNGADRRLDRMAATTLMIMESFHGFRYLIHPIKVLDIILKTVFFFAAISMIIR